MALMAAAWWLSRPVGTLIAPDILSARHEPTGTLLLQEPFRRRLPGSAQAWRIVYSTRRQDGQPAVASAIVMAVPGTGRPQPVIAWAHGTTGVVPGCAPSLLDDPFANVPALPELLDKGWIFLASDYVGLGTPGPHPYLIGEGEARSVLDAMRALRQMRGLQAAQETVVWGHSQGGHAALWTGIIAPEYAPELDILGVAAMAPASDLRSLVADVQDTPAGRIVSSFILRSYAEAYPDVGFDAYAAGWRLPLANDMSGRCLAGGAALFSAAEALLSGGSIFSRDPTRGAFGAHLLRNTPSRPIAQPLFIAQGLADELVRPDVQAGFVRARCLAGQQLLYRTFPERDHLSLLAADSPLLPELLHWTQARFNRVPFSADCSS
jgi:pimeloyl-ACP methyl ester carboxylesterase